MRNLISDFRQSLRSLRLNPAFAIGAILVLALGIGANTAIFSLVNAAMLRPLPFDDPDRLVQIWHVPPAKSFLRAKPLLGRTFTPDEGAGLAPPDLPTTTMQPWGTVEPRHPVTAIASQIAGLSPPSPSIAPTYLPTPVNHSNIKIMFDKW